MNISSVGRTKVYFNLKPSLVYTKDTEKVIYRAPPCPSLFVFVEPAQAELNPSDAKHHLPCQQREGK